MTRASDTAKLLGAGATILDGTTISTADNTTQLTLTSTDADAAVGPVLGFNRNSASAADNDLLGRLSFIGKNDADEDVDYGIIRYKITDASNGTEDSDIAIRSMVAGTSTNRISVTSAETVFNEDSKDLDFRVESDINSSAFKMDGANGNIFLNTDTDSSALITAYHHAGKAAGIAFQNSSSGVGTATGFEISMAGTGVAGLIGYVWNYENGDIRFATNNTERMRILANGGLCINRTDQANSERLAIIGNSSSQCMSLTSPITGAYDMVNLINGNGQVGRIGTSGSASQFVTSSDYRLKENVSYSFDATSRLKQLKPARFNFIADADNTLVDGFIAHEVSSIVPEAISGKKDAMAVETRYTEDDVETQGDNPIKSVGDIKTYSSTVIDPQGIDQSKLVPLLTKTILELEARITALES